MRGLLRLSCAGGLLACCAAQLMSAAPASAQGSYSPYKETATAALARYLRAFASDPRDFASLIGAGRSALELGDAQAAAGFFARADEVNPRSPLPQAGMGAVSVLNGQAQASLPYFARAQQLGATLATIGCDRGLAYDLLGRQAEAQADYRAALNGPDGDESRRRLALSLAISGNRDEALQTLAPLAAKSDVAAARTRAFVLALSGDQMGAMSAINSAMPGSSASLAPFLQRLGGLQSGQKAAAVNLGIFPDGPEVRMASATPLPPQAYGSPQFVGTVTTDRLTGIDQLLRAPAPQSRSYQAQPSQTVQMAYARPPVPMTAAPVRGTPMAAVFQPKIWLQLASGANVDDLAGRYRQLRSKNPDLFDGLRPYVARSADRARLLVGPFRGPSDAQTLAEDFESAGIGAFKWSNSQSDRIAPLTTE